jgi:hypothetical protein
MAAFYVSPDGNDSAQGTIDDPLATLDGVKEMIRKYRIHNSKKTPVTVYFREGTYQRSRTLNLDENDSGSENHPVVYKAYKNEEAIISGGKTISADFVQKVTDTKILNRIVPEARPNIRVLNLKESGINDYGQMVPRGFARPYRPMHLEFFINNQAFQLARWPNNGKQPIGKIVDQGTMAREDSLPGKGGAFRYLTNRPGRWKQAENVWLAGLFKYGWADDRIRVEEINHHEKTFSMDHATMYGFNTTEKFHYLGWFAFNLLEEIDTIGEYYLDRKTGDLYFYYPDNFSGDEKIQVSMLETPMVSIKGASNMTFDGLIFENTRGMGVYMERTENILFENCTFRNLGLLAASLGKGIRPFEQMRHDKIGVPAPDTVGSLYQHLYADPVFNRMAGKNNGFRSCEIYQTGAGGIILGGGDRLTLEPAGNFIENCKIYDFNRVYRSYRGAVKIDGVGNRLSHCLIYNGTHVGIMVHGNDHIMEYNEFHHICMDVDDMGVIYLGRDPSEYGNVVRHNFFHHIGQPDVSVMAVYADDGACGTQVYGNIFYKAGTKSVMIGGGQNNDFSNNIFIDVPLAFHIDSRLLEWSKNKVARGGIFDYRLDLVNHDEPPYSERYPELAKYWDNLPELPLDNDIVNNVFIDVEQIHNFKEMWYYPMQQLKGKKKEFYKKNKPDFEYIFEQNFITDEDPGFIDPEKLNFSLKPESSVFDSLPDFNPLPYSKIGIRQNMKE